MEHTRTFNAPPKRVGFLLMDQFTLISLSSAIDPLRVANLLSDTALYSWHLIGSGERDQVSSDGIRVTLDYTLSDEADFDLVVVVGGIDIEQSVQRSDLAWLRNARYYDSASRCTPVSVSF